MTAPSHRRQRVTTRSRLADTVARPCLVPGCPKPRARAFDGYCHAHRRAVRIYGHYDAKRVNLKREAKLEHREVLKLLHRFPGHEGVTLALRILGEWLEASANGDKRQPGYIEAARLFRYGVSAKEVLAGTAAVWLYCQRRRMPDDERLTFRLATAAMHLAPYERLRERITAVTRISTVVYRKPPRATIVDIGEFLRGTLHAIYLQIEKACDGLDAHDKAERKKLSAPFLTSTSTAAITAGAPEQ